MEEKHNWLYLGVFLNEEAKQTILDKFGNYIPQEWKIYCHHMTLVFNKHDSKSEAFYNFYKDELGKVVTLEAIQIGCSNKAMALKVTKVLPTTNEIAHITIAVSPNGKPVDSNDITNWKDISPFYISGKISECLPKKK